MRRITYLLTVAATMLAAMMAVSGVALAQEGDVCVSTRGETRVDRGDSTGFSDETSQAVTKLDSRATAVNDSVALADEGDCTATAQNGELVTCFEP